jgi:hypothetical protein
MLKQGDVVGLVGYPSTSVYVITDVITTNSEPLYKLSGLFGSYKIDCIIPNPGKYMLYNG